MSEKTGLEIPEARAKIPTKEHRQLTPELIRLRKTEDHEELTESWHEEYLTAYKKANEYRSRGDHDEALLHYRDAQAIIYYIKKRGVISEATPVREAACHYMIIQCYNNTQEDPEHVMREFHNFSLVLMDMLTMIVQHDDNAEDLLDPLIRQLKEENYIDPIVIFNTLGQFYRQIKEEEDDPWVFGWIWKLSYFLTRYSTIAHDFYMKCTPHVNLGQAYDQLTRRASELSKETLAKLPDSYFENDATGVNKVYAKLTSGWLDIYYDMLSAEASNIFGEYTEKVFQFTAEHEKYLWDIVYNYRYSEDPSIFAEDYEHAIELLALNYFNDACIAPENYEPSSKKLRKLYTLAVDSDKCERVAFIIQVYIARASLRYQDIKEAHTSYQEANRLRYGEERENIPETSRHIFDTWLNVIKSEILLRHHKSVQEITEQSNEISGKINNAAGSDIIESDYHPEHHLGMISEIEKIFQDFTSEDAKIERPKVAFLPLEARIYFILGMATLEKAKILGRKMPESDDEKNGANLLKAFYDARNYLCESYNILQNMGYKDAQMLDEIADAYIELIDFNYMISGLSEDARTLKVPRREDIPEIVRHYQLQKWIDVIYESIRTEDLSYQTDYKKVLAKALEEGVKRFLPNLTGLSITEKYNDEWTFSEELSFDKEEMYIQAIEKSDETDISEHYFYNNKDGKFVAVVPVGDDNERKIIMEISYQLTDYNKDLIKDVAKGLETLLKVFDRRKRLEESSENDDILNLKRELLESVSDLFKYLLRKHENTINHSETMAKMAAKKRMHEKGEDYEMSDTEKDMEMQIYYAYLLHDFDKAGLDPKLILDKATRLLPHEIKRTNRHSLGGAEHLRSLLGLKEFKYVIAIALAHHVKYGIDRGYPFKLPGEEIKYIMHEMIEEFENLSEEEREFLENGDGVLPDEIAKEARDIVIIDQVQALRDPGRAYRTVMPLDNLNGYLISRSGRDFDPDRVDNFISLIKAGVFDDIIAHNENEKDDLKEFRYSQTFDWDSLYEFMVKHRSEFEESKGVDLSDFIEYLEKGRNKGLKMSRSCFGAGICEMYIQNERRIIEQMETLNQLKENSPDEFEKIVRADGLERFFKDRDGYLEKLDKDLQAEIHET